VIAALSNDCHPASDAQHRFDGAVAFLHDVVQFMVRSDGEVSPARMLTPKQPKRTAFSNCAQMRVLGRYVASQQCSRWPTSCHCA
jgi:hypothetical protein